MAAPAGNEFWKFRSKHGRNKLFESPELMWQEAVAYFQWCVDNPLIEIDYRGKDAVEVQLPKMQAFTWAGLEYYLDMDLRRYKDRLNESSHSNNASYEDFVLVLTRINNVIYNQKFTGAAAGLLNPNIIARDLGLTDKTEVKQITLQEEYINYEMLSDEALKEIEDAAKIKRIES